MHTNEIESECYRVSTALVNIPKTNEANQKKNRREIQRHNIHIHTFDASASNQTHGEWVRERKWNRRIKNKYTVTHAEIYSAFIEKGIYIYINYTWAKCMCCVVPKRTCRNSFTVTSEWHRRNTYALYVRCDKIIAKHSQHTGSFFTYMCIYAYMLLQSADFFPRFPFMWCVECVCVRAHVNQFFGLVYIVCVCVCLYGK